MTRIIGIFVRTIIIFALANIVCGSLNYFSYYGRTRLPRYATCTSCNREWADAMLSSPWNLNDNYDEVPIDKEFMDISERSYNEQVNPSSSLISANLDSLNKYEHPSRKGNDYVPTMLYSDRRKFYQRDEDTFENEEPTKFDPYLTSKTSTGSSKQDGILNQHSFMLRPKSDSYGRSFNRNFYQLPRKFSEFDDRRIRNFENEKEYNKVNDRSNRLNNGIYLNKKVPSFYKENDREDYYRPSRKLTVVYRADQDERMFEQNDDKSDLTDLFKESTKIPETYEESSDESSIVNFDSNSYLTRDPLSRDKMIYNNNNNNNNNNNWFNKLSPNDYLTRNYYNNMGRKSDVSKIIDRDRLLSDRKEIVSFRQLDHDKSSGSLVISNDEDYKMKVSAKNGGHILGQHDITNNEEEKLHPMQEAAVKIFNVDDDDSSIKEESSFKFDPDFLDDIEYPSAELTEPTPTDESTESSMMTEN